MWSDAKHVHIEDDFLPQAAGLRATFDKRYTRAADLGGAYRGRVRRPVGSVLPRECRDARPLLASDATCALRWL